MSFREREKIEGKLKLVDIRKLRDMLVTIYAKEVAEEIKGKNICKYNLPIISKRMCKFEIFSA